MPRQRNLENERIQPIPLYALASYLHKRGREYWRPFIQPRIERVTAIPDPTDTYDADTQGEGIYVPTQTTPLTRKKLRSGERTSETLVPSQGIHMNQLFSAAEMYTIFLLHAYNLTPEQQAHVQDVVDITTFFTAVTVGFTQGASDEDKQDRKALEQSLFLLGGQEHTESDKLLDTLAIMLDEGTGLHENLQILQHRVHVEVAALILSETGNPELDQVNKGLIRRIFDLLTIQTTLPQEEPLPRLRKPRRS